MREQLSETPERSDTWIAEDLGVDHRTVTKIRLAAAAGAQFAHLPDPTLLPSETLGRDGKRYPYRPRLELEEGPEGSTRPGLKLIRQDLTRPCTRNSHLAALFVQNDQTAHGNIAV